MEKTVKRKKNSSAVYYGLAALCFVATLVLVYFLPSVNFLFFITIGYLPYVWFITSNSDEEEKKMPIFTLITTLSALMTTVLVFIAVDYGYFAMFCGAMIGILLLFLFGLYWCWIFKANSLGSLIVGLIASIAFVGIALEVIDMEHKEQQLINNLKPTTMVIDGIYKRNTEYYIIDFKDYGAYPVNYQMITHLAVGDTVEVTASEHKLYSIERN